MSSIICLVCGKEFETNNPRQQKYCSLECRNKVLIQRKVEKRTKKRLEKFEENKYSKCLVCGKEFERTFGTHSYSQKYCCKGCRRKAERLFGNKQQTDLEYKNFIRFGGNRFDVLERDEYTCQICGNVNQLVIHHKDESGQSDNVNNEIDNLVTLCRRCHVNIHKNKLI